MQQVDLKGKSLIDLTIGEIESFIKERNDKFINYKQWQKVDQSEIERGQELGRPRLKYTDVDEILDVAKK